MEYWNVIAVVAPFYCLKAFVLVARAGERPGAATWEWHMPWSVFANRFETTRDTHVAAR